MSTINLTTAVSLILTAGGGAFVAGVVRSWSALRSGARVGQREVVADLMAWRDDLERQHRDACRDRDFWRDVAAQRGAQLRELGIVPAVADAVQPSDRREHRRRGR